MDGIIVKERSYPKESKLLYKSASGCTEIINIFEVSNINTTLKYLRDKNFWVYGFSANSDKDFIELNLLQPSSIKDLKNELVKMIDDDFNGNQNFKKIVMSSAFCSENDNIVSDNFKIDKKQTFGIIPPVGGG